MLNFCTLVLVSTFVNTLGCLYLLRIFRFSQKILMLFGIRFSRNKYRPLMQTVEIKGFEPLTPCLQGRCSPN